MKMSIRFALSAIRGELFEREREKERYSFGILYMGYLLSILKIKREKEIEEREREEREREEKEREERERKERERRKRESRKREREEREREQ
jgi:hypothetical protein